MKTLIGPVIHRKKFESAVKVHVKQVDSNFRFRFRSSADWGRCLSAIESDEERAELIAKIIEKETHIGNSTLVLSRRIAHLELIASMCNNGVRVLTGRLPKQEREQIIADFKEGKIKCLLATQLADEALDVPILSRIVLSFPGKHDGRIIQQVGRALRTHPDKSEAIIYDINDRRVGVLQRQFLKRKKAYKKMGIKVR
jgi:superfamily II DNA or RNA helicase